MLSMILIAATTAQISPAQEPTRESLVAQYRSVMKRWDQDRDERLSFAEIDHMVETGLRSPQPLSADDETSFNEAMRGFYRDQDINRDGFVDGSELQQGALSAFACIDADRNGRASSAEMQQSASRCLSR
ncbi:hypothetical protein SH591_00540 [Sphingomonas sp. LY54]|uniref:hypothetical protein n=1 Tax=Sphingomonas sp. LY54 TaxID=3095343 RepID=UPI002D780585|nr:hypothetical protein [Sphingomonas sp. LY54]WRP28711.1 hypothetical protein SH591_00540 [Sphingomonas sp. LY54]